MSFLIIGILFFLRVLSWLIIIRVLLSWFVPQANNRLILFIYDTSDAVLMPIRHIFRLRGRIDWTPLIAIILIDLIQYGIVRIFS